MKMRIGKNSSLDEPLCWSEEKGWLRGWEEQYQFRGWMIATQDGYLYASDTRPTPPISLGDPVCEIDWRDYKNWGTDLN